MKPVSLIVWSTVAIVVFAAAGPVVVCILNAAVTPVALIAVSVALVRVAWFFTRPR